MKISYFGKVTDVRPAQVPCDLVLKGIKEGRVKPQIEAIRNATPAEQERLKKELPGVTFGGTFSKRSMKGLIEASGLLCLDFDVEGFTCPDTLLPYVYAYFRSPRGGLKILVNIPVVKDDLSFKAHFRALAAEYEDIDPSGKDISRICFLSYDPDLYLNEQAQVWEKRIEAPEEERQPLSLENRPVPTQTNWSKISLGLKMIKTAQVGNRHDNCLKAGNLMGGYIASGEISEDDVQVLVREIEATSTEPKDHVRAFMDGVNRGKSLPLHSSKRGEPDVYKERKAIKEEWKASDRMGDIYYNLKDEAIEDEIMAKWKNGNQRGLTTGWDSLDGLYSILMGYITIIYGAPTMGKSIWTMNLLMNLARNHDMYHCLFTPEMGTPAEVYSMLIQIYVGKDLDNTYGNRMTKEELTAAMEFVNNHFIILDNEETGDEVTIETLCLYVDFLERKINRKINTVTVDPLVELMMMDNDVRDDVYWNYELKRARVMAKSGQRHLFLIHHSKDPGKPSGRDDYGNNVYPQPSPHDIAFGQTFYRKAFFLINVWYHYAEGARTGDLINLKCIRKEVIAGHTYIKVVKAKPEGAGQRGEVALRFNKEQHRFFDDTAMPLPAPKAIRDPSEPQQQQIMNFEPETSEGPSWLED